MQRTKSIFLYPLFFGLVLSCQSPESNEATNNRTLFTQLNAEVTGITFNNEVTDEKEHNILLYSNYYGGAGVGVGDFDKDGLPDLYFAGNLVNDQLYHNQGGFQFKDISSSAGLENTGSWSSGVIVGDVNGDGWEDIYVTCELYDDQPALRANKLYINQGNLTFKNEAAQWGVADTARTRHATFLDYDKDGDLDLFVLNQPPNPGNYSPYLGADLGKDEYTSRLYQNTGNQFIDVTEQAGVLKTGFPNSVVATDLDKDGYTDLYIANDFDAPDFLYHNNGDGTFTDILKTSTGHTSFYSMGVDAADINNDGWQDLMVLDMVAEDNFRLKANMSGMNPDNFWKVVRNGGHYQYMFNTLLLNRGLNTFGDIAQYAGIAATDWSWSNLFADLDNDGLKDLYVTNGLVRDIRNTDADKKFTKHVVETSAKFIEAYPDSSNISMIDIIDLEESLKIIPSEKLTNYAYRNTGDAAFEKKTVDWGLDQKSFSNGSAYADLNNDGHLDLIVNNINEAAFIFKNEGASVSNNHFLRIKLEDPNQATTLGTTVMVDINGTKQYVTTTSVRGMYSTSEQIVHFGIGKAESVDKIEITWPDGSITTQSSVAADQLLVVAKANTSQPKNALKPTLFQARTDNKGLEFKHQENYFDDYRFQVLLPHELSHYGPAMAVADVNGDGLEDLFFGGASGQTGSLLLQRSNGSFQKATQQPWRQQSIMEDVDAIFFDVDLDGDQDLYIGSGGNAFEANHFFYTDRLYLNDGSGNFTYEANRLPELHISTGVALSFDYDGDGDQDLFVGERFIPRDYPAPGSGYLLENKNGHFNEVTGQLAPDFDKLGLITDAISTDLDQDGNSDLMITGEWMTPKIFLNKENGFIDHTGAYGLDSLHGWWFSIQKADFDQDGDEDFILGNLGTNYKYQASKEEPFEVYYNDFDGNGSKDIVLSYYNFGKQYPVRGKSCSTQQVPDLSKKFDTYELFAASGLNEIYEPEKLQGGLHLIASHFESVILENKGTTLVPKALPAPAQWAPIMDVTIDDFNRDGNLDVIYGGNLYVSEIETSRADAGIGGLLLGDGQGNFKAVPASESGIYVPKDIREIEQVSVDGNNVLVFATNDDEVVTLERTLR